MRETCSSGHQRSGKVRWGGEEQLPLGSTGRVLTGRPVGSITEAGSSKGTVTKNYRGALAFFFFIFCFIVLQASKVFIKVKQIAPRDAGSGEKSSRALLSYRGFYPLKMGAGTNLGSIKMWFSPIGLAQLPVSVLVQ